MPGKKTIILVPVHLIVYMYTIGLGKNLSNHDINHLGLIVSVALARPSLSSHSVCFHWLLLMYSSNQACITMYMYDITLTYTVHVLLWRICFRHQQLLDVLKGTPTIPLGITVFPRLGCPGFTEPQHEPHPQGGASRSLFFPNDVVWRGHPRYMLVTVQVTL